MNYSLHFSDIDTPPYLFHCWKGVKRSLTPWYSSTKYIHLSYYQNYLVQNLLQIIILLFGFWMWKFGIPFSGSILSFWVFPINNFLNLNLQESDRLTTLYHRKSSFTKQLRRWSVITMELVEYFIGIKTSSRSTSLVSKLHRACYWPCITSVALLTCCFIFLEFMIGCLWYVWVIATIDSLTPTRPYEFFSEKIFASHLRFKYILTY